MNVADIFVALVISDDKRQYVLYLVNESNETYERVVGFTGAHDGSGDELIETSRVRSDLDGLDFAIWYHLDLYGWQDFGPYQLFVLVPKYTWGYREKAIEVPVLNRKRMVLPLAIRIGKPISG